tara:strand:+ start:1005 stop:1160 length:156 start_codon:yes stop_codon:yes gene_type:complete
MFSKFFIYRLMRANGQYMKRFGERAMILYTLLAVLFSNFISINHPFLELVI